MDLDLSVELKLNKYHRTPPLRFLFPEMVIWISIVSLSLSSFTIGNYLNYQHTVTESYRKQYCLFSGLGIKISPRENVLKEAAVRLD